nr:hypothetical protein [uncultured Campylobacter sp.]
MGSWLNLGLNLIYVASNLASFWSKAAVKFACSFNYAAKFSVRRAIAAVS